MKREIRLSPRARQDVARLAEFLAAKSPGAARRAVDSIRRGLQSLEESSERGREVAPGLRELRIRFGRDGYVARYRLDDGAIIVSRIYHAREVR